MWTRVHDMLHLEHRSVGGDSAVGSTCVCGLQVVQRERLAEERAEMQQRRAEAEEADGAVAARVVQVRTEVVRMPNSTCLWWCTGHYVLGPAWPSC